MRKQPILLGIVGDSGAGKTTFTQGIIQVLGEDRVAVICTDDYHKYNRTERAEKNLTPLHPDCNYLDIVEQHLLLVKAGQPILKPNYNHSTGDFSPPSYIQPKEFIIVEGLLGYFTKTMRDCYDVKLYLAPPDDLNVPWKIKRDTQVRGYTKEAALREIRVRPHADRRVERGDRLLEPSLLDARVTRELNHLHGDWRRHGLDVERDRHREVLQQRRGIQQHRARADDAEAIEGLQPGLAVRDRGRALPEDEDLAFIRNRSAGHQVDEHFGGAGVEAGDGDALSGGDRELVDPQRAKPVVRPPHVREAK